MNCRAITKMLTITIGSDPEMFVLCGLEPYPAEKALGDTVALGREELLKLPLGADPTAKFFFAELRPVPAKDPITHLRTIRDMMHRVPYTYKCPKGKKLSAIVPPAMEVTLPDGKKRVLSVGGHIHFGYDRAKAIKDRKEAKEKAKPIIDEIGTHEGKEFIEALLDTKKLRGNMARFLGYFAGVPYYLIEPQPEGRLRRERTKYGRMSNYREQEYGIEWRMCSSWLFSPEIAGGILSLSYVVAFEYLQMPYIINYTQIRNLLRSRSLFMSLTKGISPEEAIKKPVTYDPAPYRMEYGVIKHIVRNFYLYPRYRREITRFFGLIDEYYTYSPYVNIIPNW